MGWEDGGEDRGGTGAAAGLTCSGSSRGPSSRARIAARSLKSPIYAVEERRPKADVVNWTDILLAVLALCVGVALAWRSAPLAKVTLFASAIVVSGLLFLPGSQLVALVGEDLERWLEGVVAVTPWTLSDWMHFAIFAWLGMLLWLGRPDLRGWKGWAAIVVLAVAAEIMQLLSVDRQAKLDDVLLNLAGGILGGLLGIWIRAALNEFWNKSDPNGGRIRRKP